MTPSLWGAGTTAKLELGGNPEVENLAACPLGLSSVLLPEPGRTGVEVDGLLVAMIRSSLGHRPSCTDAVAAPSIDLTGEVDDYGKNVIRFCGEDRTLGNDALAFVVRLVVARQQSEHGLVVKARLKREMGWESDGVEPRISRLRQVLQPGLRGDNVEHVVRSLCGTKKIWLNLPPAQIKYDRDRLLGLDAPMVVKWAQQLRQE